MMADHSRAFFKGSEQIAVCPQRPGAWIDLLRGAREGGAARSLRPGCVGSPGQASPPATGAVWVWQGGPGWLGRGRRFLPELLPAQLQPTSCRGMGPPLRAQRAAAVGDPSSWPVGCPLQVSVLLSTGLWAPRGPRAEGTTAPGPQRDELSQPFAGRGNRLCSGEERRPSLCGDSSGKGPWAFIFANALIS